MAHIKKMVLYGFKSFARRTEIIFDKGINVIVGPNGSGKSNVSDALCFVLGRLSVKSMRAAKAKNLIFMGSKYVKPAREASVEIVFDNHDRAFAIDKDEISIKRSVRLNGQGLYKMNEETKTRSEIIEALAQAGIDPYGFNLILQGEIQSIVKMHPEERRKIIEEVAGISIYETRKEKSLHELEKTDEKLKEISTTLRERTTFLNNLEKERSQAQRYQDLKVMSRRLKASILRKKIDEKTKEVDTIVKAIEEKSSQIQKKREKTEKIQTLIQELTDKINQINKHIQQATGLEQTKLRDEITTLRADLEGLRVRKEGYEHRAQEIELRIEEMKKSIPEMESEISSLRQKSPLMAQKAKELKKKKEELAQLEDERKKQLSLKTEFQTLRDRIADKQKQVTRAISESESLLKQIEALGTNLKFTSDKECRAAIDSFRQQLAATKQELQDFHKAELEYEKKISIAESEISRSEEIKSKVEKIDTCPLCQSKITEEHIQHVFDDADAKIKQAKESIQNASHELDTIHTGQKSYQKKISETEEKIFSSERELSTHKTILEKTQLMKQATEYEQSLRKELQELEQKRSSLENKVLNLVSIEDKYQEKILEIEEISSRTELDVDTTLMYKEREIEKTRGIIDRSTSDLKELKQQIKEIITSIETKEENLAEKETREEELNQRFQKMFQQRDALQNQIQAESMNLSTLQTEIRQIEDQTNYLKIGKAKLDSERETLEVDFSDYKDAELVQGSLVALEERLQKTTYDLDSIGAINMRALEVYDEVKKEYDSVREKLEVLEKEKAEILKIIEEIDKKKQKTFMKTFKAINALFTRNFSKLSTKGIAYLEIENQENMFEGGVNIIVRLAKGKYFDVTSLSGGEQTLVALSLLFAIQEYKPYQFYVLDEIDAALDKRNSERLAALLDQYMKAGQYIVITHNDAIILNSNLLYGVSMHDGVSKILSLKLSETPVSESGELLVKDTGGSAEYGSEAEEPLIIDDQQMLAQKMQEAVDKLQEEAPLAKESLIAQDEPDDESELENEEPQEESEEQNSIDQKS